MYTSHDPAGVGLSRMDPCRQNNILLSFCHTHVRDSLCGCIYHYKRILRLCYSIYIDEKSVLYRVVAIESKTTTPYHFMPR